MIAFLLAMLAAAPPAPAPGAQAEPPAAATSQGGPGVEQGGAPSDPVPASPQGPRNVVETQLERDTRQLAAELRCPVCQGLSLQDSPSELSQEMRDIIRDQLVAGKSVAEVKEYFVAKYGEWILLEPEPHGFNLTVYVLPVLLLLGGAAFLYSTARRWTRQQKERTEQPG